MEKFLKWSRVLTFALAITPFFLFFQYYSGVVEGLKSSTTFSYNEKGEGRSVVIIERDAKDIINDNNIKLQLPDDLNFQKYQRLTILSKQIQTKREKLAEKNRIDMLKKIRAEKQKQQIQLKKKLMQQQSTEVKRMPSRGEVSHYTTIYVIATAYTAGYESTGKTPNSPNYGKTASGTRAVEGRTIACPKNMELGTKIFIPYFNSGFICEDRGGAIRNGRIDIYMESVKDAREFGKKELEIKILQ